MGHTHHDKPGTLRIAALALAVALIAAACSGGSDDAGRTTSDVADEGAVTPAGATTTAAPSSNADLQFSVGASPESLAANQTSPANQTDDPTVVPALQPRDIGRDIVFTAEIAVAVRDVAAASESASRIIAGLGGLLFGQRSVGGTDPQSVLTFKVFPEDFAKALDALGGIGDVRSQTVSADDVTERIVDLESRIKTAEASVERLQRLLEAATDINTVANLETQLLQRETDLERLRGQLRTLEDQVSLATIVLTITQAFSQPQIAMAVTAYPGDDNLGIACPGNNNLVIEAGEPATLCVHVRNTGDTALANLDLREPALGLDLGDFTVVSGDPAAVLEPGDSVVLAYGLLQDDDVRLRPTVTATPVDEDGSPIGTNVADTNVFLVETFVVDPGGLPGFREALAASWGLFQSIVGVGVVMAGAIVPFLWLIAIAALVLWWRRRRHTDAAGLATTIPNS